MAAGFSRLDFLPEKLGPYNVTAPASVRAGRQRQNYGARCDQPVALPRLMALAQSIVSSNRARQFEHSNSEFGVELL